MKNILHSHKDVGFSTSLPTLSIGRLFNYTHSVAFYSHQSPLVTLKQAL